MEADRRESRCSLVIAATPRSGSTLLCDLLESTEVAGRPREYFHVNFVPTMSKQLGLDPEGITSMYIEGILEQTSTDNGIFSTKLHWLQINQLADALRDIYGVDEGTMAGSLIERALPSPRYVYLRREDKGRQAVSYFRAMRSDRWSETTSGPDSGGLQPAAHVPLQPDYLQIRWWEDHIREEEGDWMKFFSTFAITPMVVTYEDLVADSRREIARVLTFVGVHDSRPVETVKTTLRRQADDETELVLVGYRQVRDLLPSIPSGWVWSWGNRAFIPGTAIDGAD
jgi:trehalose 2-sulfotransferase